MQKVTQSNYLIQFQYMKQFNNQRSKDSNKMQSIRDRPLFVCFFKFLLHFQENLMAVYSIIYIFIVM